MDVFISWSGKRSGAAAEALHDWLPKIINALKPWLSAADIDKGARWGSETAVKLKEAKAGIICLTPSNLHSDWLLFEAGALSKTIENTYVCPFLIGLEPADVKPPLAQFQATRATKPDVLKLLKTLNSALGESALPVSHIEEAFEVWWPRLEVKLDKLPVDDAAAAPRRADRDLLEEILALVRGQNRSKISKLPDEISPAMKREVLNREIFERIRDVDPALASTQLLSSTDEENSVYQARRFNGKTYCVTVPADFLEERLREFLQRQIPSEDVPILTGDAQKI